MPAAVAGAHEERQLAERGATGEGGTEEQGILGEAPSRLLDPPRQADPPPSTAAPVRLADLERDHIRHVLAHTRGHQGRAAALLGISRKSLWEKRRRYGIP